MASSAVMLLLGFIVAIVLVVFLSNAAPSKTQVAEPTGQVMESGTPQVAAKGLFGGMGPGQGPVAEPQVPQSQAPVTMTYAPASSSNKDQIASGETILEGGPLTSKNGKYVFTYLNGRVAIKSGNFSMWESDGTAFPGGVVKITDDGNVGIFSSAYSVSPIGWSSATAGRGTAPYVLQIRDDGNLVLFDSTNQIVWKPDITLPPVGVDCVMDEWTDWSPCTAPCGGGTQMRTRAIIRQGNSGGKACEATYESRKCNEATCPDCTLSDWSTWSACLNPNAQGVGTKTKTKTVTNPGGPGGLACPTPDSSDMLAQESCQNCVYSAWNPSDWTATACELSTGLKTQTRTITTPAANGGDACTEPLTRTQPCAVACGLGALGDWGACDGANRKRTTKITVTPKNGGQSCVDVYKAQVTGANVTCSETSCTETQTCAPCVLSTTQQVETKACPEGNKAGSRKFKWSIATAAVNGGACDQPEITEVCPVVDCAQSTKKYGDCVPKTGKKSWTRETTTEPRGGGKACEAASGEDDCDVDCVVGDWSKWGDCDKKCGGGTQTRTRTVKTDKKNNGKACPTLSESQACNTQACIPTVTNIYTQFNDSNPRGHDALWYHGNGQMNTNYRVRFGDAAPDPMEHNANGIGRYTMPDVFVRWDTPYTGTVWLESSADGWAKMAKQDVNNATSVMFPRVSLTSIISWNGKLISTNGRCGPDFNGTACGGSACCSQWGWCGGTVNGQSPWCANPKVAKGGWVVYTGIEDGAYDGAKACSIQ